MWTVTLSSLKQCAKTYEIRHTPTPVRVTEALQAAVLEGVARPARARAGLLLAWDLKYRSRPGLITPAGAQLRLRVAILRDGALARAPVSYRRPAWEKGYAYLCGYGNDIGRYRNRA